MPPALPPKPPPGEADTLVPNHIAEGGATLDGPTLPSAPPPARLVPVPERYEYRGRLDEGGQAEVLRVWDKHLGRELAMKLIRAEHLASSGHRERFLLEVRTIAGLQHDHLIVVHDSGFDEEGRPWYTMPIVPGARTMADAMEEGSPERAGDGRALLTILRKVADAVAFAHSRGVLHRDLKPQNVLLSDTGQVFVADWGLARAVHAADPDGVRGAVPTPTAGRGLGTLAGFALGTWPYLPPEQLRGETRRHGRWSDVYALGAILWEVLYGTPIYPGHWPDPALVAKGPPRPDPRAAVPPRLAALAAECLEHDPDTRLADAARFARTLDDWLSAQDRRDRARAVLAEARRALAPVERHRAEARRLREAADLVLGQLPPHAPVSAKEPGWRLEDAAAELERDVASARVHVELQLRAALAHDPELAEARDALADLYRDLLLEAEAEQRPADAARWEGLLREVDAGRDRHLAWLDGEAQLSLRTDPPGALVTLYRWEEQARRLVPVRVRTLGVTPLDRVRLPPGSWLLLLERRGFHEVRYPVELGRGEHWDAAGPDGQGSLWLPPLGALGAEDCYVPGGWCRLGGDPLATDPLPASRAWLAPFVLRRHPVRVREYLAFLDHLHAAGEAEALAAFSPREAAAPGAAPQPLTRVGAEGRVELVRREGGLVWDPEMPVVLVDQRAAWAYAAWVAERSGLPWRLPLGVEREKAGRGVDGRRFPWGSFPEPTWCGNVAASAEAPRPVPVTSFPVDHSCYGVAGLAGNVRDWCAEGYQRNPAAGGSPSDRVVVRGGSWNSTIQVCRLAGRFAAPPTHCFTSVGVRLARGVD